MKQFFVNIDMDLLIEAEDIAEAGKKLQNLVMLNEDITGVMLQDYACTPFKEIKEAEPQ